MGGVKSHLKQADQQVSHVSTRVILNISLQVTLVYWLRRFKRHQQDYSQSCKLKSRWHKWISIKLHTYLEHRPLSGLLYPNVESKGIHVIKQTLTCSRYYCTIHAYGIKLHNCTVLSELFQNSFCVIYIIQRLQPGWLKVNRCRKSAISRLSGRANTFKSNFKVTLACPSYSLIISL